MVLTAIFCHIDEFCKTFEKELSKKFFPGRKRSCVCRMTLSEILTITVYFHYSGYKNFKDYYCKHICGPLRSAFTLVSYNRFNELQKESLAALAFLAKFLNTNKHDGISFIDSSPLRVCHIKRASSHKTFRRWARKSKTSVGWFFGFKLHLVVSSEGEILNFSITRGNVADNNKTVVEELTQHVSGKLYGDRGYISKKIFSSLLSRGIQLVTRIKSNMKNKLMTLFDKLMLRKRALVESVIFVLKNSFCIEQTRHRSSTGFLTNVYGALVAYAFRPSKPSISFSAGILEALA